MMKRIYTGSLVAILIAGMFSVTSCLNTISGEGELTIAGRNLEPFTKVELDIDANLILTDSLQQSCMISAQENLMPEIETKIRGEKLIISSEKNIHSEKPVTIYLSVNRLSAIELNGSGNITATNNIKTSDLHIDISGSGNMELSPVCDKLKAEISGSGKLDLAGSSNESSMEISGSGIIDAFNHNTGNCRVDISGSGMANVFPSGVLKADVTGSGKVRYKGNPTDIKPSVTGSGSIEKSE